MKTSPLRVAIVGYGLAGSVFHAPLVAATPGLEAGPQPPAPQVRELPWLVAADVSEPSGEGDVCRAPDGSPAGVRCASSLEGREAAGELASQAGGCGHDQRLELGQRLGPSPDRTVASNAQRSDGLDVAGA